MSEKRDFTASARVRVTVEVLNLAHMEQTGRR